MSMNPVAARIQALLEQRGMTRADLHRATGIPYHRLNPWFIRESAKPRAEDIEKVATALGASARHLLNGDPIGDPAARDWILSVYDRLGEGDRDQLEQFVRFLDEQSRNQAKGRDPK